MLMGVDKQARHDPDGREGHEPIEPGRSTRPLGVQVERRKGRLDFAGGGKQIHGLTYRRSSMYAPKKTVATVLSLALAVSVCSLLWRCALLSRPPLPLQYRRIGEAASRLAAAPVAPPECAASHRADVVFDADARARRLVRRGIIGSSNVASVEVRTAAFSINSMHVAPGRLSLSHPRARVAPALSPPFVRTLHHRSKYARAISKLSRRRLRVE